jgi:hypothetical protein
MAPPHELFGLSSMRFHRRLLNVFAPMLYFFFSYFVRLVSVYRACMPCPFQTGSIYLRSHIFDHSRGYMLLLSNSILLMLLR